MKLKTFILFIFLITFFNISAQNFTEYYFTFNIKDKSELKEITQIISIDKVTNQAVYAYATDKNLEKFKHLGYKYTLLEHPGNNVKENLATTIAEMENWDKYPTYDLYVEMMNYYETNYPEICKVVNIGSTVDGRDLLALKITDNVNTEENEPEFFYTSTMHGDETTGFVLMLRLADSLLTSYGIEPEITNLVNEIEIYINPNANPDGTYRSDNSTISSPTRYNANGVDLNRNFPDPAYGDHPDGNSWQLETEAMMDFANNHHFVLSANFHGGIELANYPWDHTYRRHPDDSWFINVSRDYATSAQNNSPSGYFTGQNNGITNGADWYIVHGSRQDYYTFFHNSREITFEISNTKFVSGSTLPNYWNYNKEALFQFMTECLYGIKGTVKNIDGDPLNAMIFIQGHDTDEDSSMVFTDPDVGDYHRMIYEGTYNIIASSYGYFNDTIKDFYVPENSSVTANFVLQQKNNYNISGTVSAAGTGEPLENAEIYIDNNAYTAITNSSGKYSLENIPEGSHQFSVFKAGYTKENLEITITEQDTIFNFQLFAADIEDFETSDFTKFNWQFSDDADWSIDNGEVYEGSYAAKSGNISDNQTTTLIIDTTIIHGGNLSFYKKVSSESGYDYLKFYINDELQDQWSGDIDWSFEEYNVDSGEQTFKWEYSKDGGVSTGEDCAWVDYISFPKFKVHVDSIDLTFEPQLIADTLFFNDSIQYEIVITNNSSAQNTTYSITVENENNHPWITLNKNSGNIYEDNQDTVTVTLNSFQSNKGNYYCNILLTSADLEIDTIPVSFTIMDTLTIDYSPASIKDTLFILESSSKNLVISNTGIVETDFMLEIENPTDNQWVNLDKNSGHLALNQSDTIIVNFITNSYEFGHYNTNIILHEEDGDKHYIPVHLTILDTIALTYSPESIIDTLYKSDNSIHNLMITNSGALDINYFLEIENSEENQWISLNNDSGNLDLDQTDIITVSLQTSDLDFGSYYTNLILQEQDDDTFIIPVSLTVIDPIESTLDINEITDTLSTDTIKHYPVIITNTGREAIDYSIFEDEINGYEWISIDQESGQIPVRSKDTVIVKINSEGLEPGNYQAKLIYLEQDGDEKNINIEINVKSSTVSIYDLQDFAIIAKIYPNPFNDYLTIKFDKAYDSEFIIKIFNIYGQIVFEQIFKNNDKIIKKINLMNLVQLSKGSYIIQIIADDFVQSKKIIKY